MENEIKIIELIKDVAVREMKNDKKDTNWIMFYRDKLFPDVKRSELESSVRKIDKDKGIGR